MFVVLRSDEGISPERRFTSRDKEDEGAKAENDDDKVPLSLLIEGYGSDRYQRVSKKDKATMKEGISPVVGEVQIHGPALLLHLDRNGTWDTY